MLHVRSGILAALALSYLLVFISPAPAHASGTISFLGQYLEPMAIDYSDVWGWVDPNTGKEYALIGWANPPASGTTIIDVSNPALPVQASVVLSPTADIKTWQHYMYTVNGSLGTGYVWDIQDPSNPDSVGFFPSGHNAFIDDQGFLYVAFPGLVIYDLKPDPTSPAEVYSDMSNIFAAHDMMVVGNTMYFFGGSEATYIYDVTNRAVPVLLGSIIDPSINYHHSGWPTADAHYLYLADELALGGQPDITIWDISNPATPMKVGAYTDPGATVHNPFAMGQILFTSYYSAGFRVFDISTPDTLVLCDTWDTNAKTGEDYIGNWGCYPFAPSGNIYLSDRDNGLILVRFHPDGINTGIETATAAALSLHNVPNPFNPTTRILFTLPQSGRVRLDIFDVTGRRLRTLIDGARSAGPHAVEWDGRTDAGRPLASGTYFYRLSTLGETLTRKAVLAR